MLIIFEQKVPSWSDASQNDHKIKGYPSKTLKAPSASAFEIDFQKSYYRLIVFFLMTDWLTEQFATGICHSPCKLGLTLPVSLLLSLAQPKIAANFCQCSTLYSVAM